MYWLAFASLRPILFLLDLILLSFQNYQKPSPSLCGASLKEGEAYVVQISLKTSSFPAINAGIGFSGSPSYSMAM